MKAFLLLYILTAFAAYEAEANLQNINTFKSAEGALLSVKISSGKIIIRPSILPIIMKTDLNYPLATRLRPYLEGQNMVHITYRF